MSILHAQCFRYYLKVAAKMVLKVRAWNLRGDPHVRAQTSRMQVSLSLCVCVYVCDMVPGCVFHKSSVIIKAVDTTISGAARLGWQQSSDHLMEQFISIMLHYQMRKENISVQENRRTLKVFWKKSIYSCGQISGGWWWMLFGVSCRVTQQG